MAERSNEYHSKYFCTFVITSIFLISVLVSHNAFADQVVSTIPVGVHPFGIGVNPDTNKIYVANMGSTTAQVRSLSIIDGSTDTVVSTIQGKNPPVGVGVNPVTNKIYVTDLEAGNSVSVIDGSTDTVVNNIPVGDGAEGVGINPNTNKIYVANFVGTVSVIDGSTDTVVNTIPVGTWSREVGVNSATNMIYVTNEKSNTVSVIDGSTDTVVDTIQNVSNDTYGIGVNPATNKIYVLGCVYDSTGQCNGLMRIIDGATNTVTGTIQNIPGSYSVVLNPNTKKLYVANSEHDNVSVIDSLSNTILNTIPVGNSPGIIGVNPATNKIYVTNLLSNTVSVIDSSPAPSATLDASFQTYQFGIIQILGNVQNPIPGVNQTQLLVYAPNGNLVLNKTESTAFEDWYGISRSEGKGNYTIILKYNNDVLANNSLASCINNDPVIGFIDPSEAGDGSVSIQSGVGYSLAGEPISVAINDPSNSTLATFTAPLLGKGQFNFEINSTTAKQIFTKSGNYTIVLTHIPTGVQRSVVLAYTASTTTSSAPQNLQSAAGNSQVALSWSTPQNNGGSSITNYNVYRGTSSGSETLLAQVGNDTSYNDGTVTNGQTYFYTVTAVNSVGESYPSNEVSATPIGPPQPPTGLIATGALLKINLSWNPPSNDGGSPITGYMIEKSTDNGNTWATIVSSTGSTGTTYSDSNVLPLVTYTYRVSAINDVGTSSPSNIASATTTSATPPPAGIVLNNIQSTSGTTSSSNSVTLANFNTGTGDNKLLVVGISADNSDVNSITFNGMSLIRKAGSFYNNDAEFWYLKNPSGTGDIVVTMNGQTSAVVGAYSFSGVNQTSPLPTSTSKHNTTPNSPNITLTTKFANDWVLDLPSIYGGSTLGSPTCTQQWDDNVPDAITGASSSQMVPTPGAITCKWTASSGDLWDDAAVEIKASK